MHESYLATVVRIVNVSPHPDTALLDITTVLGFQVPVGKNEFSVGDLAVFIRCCDESNGWLKHLSVICNPDTLRAANNPEEFVLPKEGDDVTDWLK